MNMSGAFLSSRHLISNRYVAPRGLRLNVAVACRLAALFAIVALSAQLAVAQARPHVTAVDPSSGKVNDNLILMGDNLGKDLVSAVFLSDDTMDHKAAVVDQ